MNTKHFTVCLLISSLLVASSGSLNAQGFINLDFESGQFIPIPGQPYEVQFAPAMPGWTGYLGTNQVDWILYNTLTLGSPAISIHGPDDPSPNYLHGDYYVQFQNGFPGPFPAVPAIAQTGLVPVYARSLQFFTFAQFAVGFQVTLAGTPIPVYHLDSLSNGAEVWGGDVSAFAGRYVELRFRGNDFLDNIQFLPTSLPEPGAFGLAALGGGWLAWALRRRRH